MDVNPVFPGGPYCVAALLCERVLEEKDNVKSLVRVIDRLYVQAVGERTPESMPPTTGHYVMYLRFRAGKATGPMELAIYLTSPNGDRTPGPRLPLFFEEGEARYVDVVIGMDVQLSLQGRYWFEAHLGEQRVAAIPFEVIYMPVGLPPAPGATQ